jgi:hypothetical protein
MSDPYYRLKPPEPTTAEDICACVAAYPLKLMFALGYNPVHCMACNREVAPEVYRPDQMLSEAIAYWRELYRALYMLWLDSADYEDWAATQLNDMSSRVNQLGLAVRESLNGLRRTYYWLFEENVVVCPICSRPMEKSPLGVFRQVVCERCSLVAAVSDAPASALLGGGLRD